MIYLIETMAHARRENKDMRDETRLKTLEIGARATKSNQFAAVTGVHSAYVSKLAAKYKKAALIQSPVIITVEITVMIAWGRGRSDSHSFP